MRVVLALTGRNLLLFARDPLRIFLSLLSALIVFLLYTFFLGNLQFASIIERSPTADPGHVHGFVDAWMFAGIVALCTITAPLGALSVMLDDTSSDRFRDFLVSPIKRGQLVMGYLSAAFVIGSLITLVMLAIALLYLSTVSGVTLGVPEVARSVVFVLLSTATFTALWALVVSFLRTSGSFSAVSTIVGTVSGFLAGAFIALGLLPEAVRSIVSALPFAQAAMLLRSEFTSAAASTLADGDPTAIKRLNEFYGVTLSVGPWDVSSWSAVGLLAFLAIGFTLLAAARIRSRIR